MLCVGFFPSWRESGWRHWRVYAGSDGLNPKALSHAMGLTKAPKPVAEGDLPERTAIRLYVFVGVIMIIIVF